MEETKNKDYYWQMYADVWAYHKKYINDICDSDEFWEKAVSESNQIAKKYGENKFIVGLLLNEVNEMERIYKAKRRAQDEQKVSCISTKSTVAGNKTESV